MKKVPTALQWSNMLAAKELKAQRIIAGTYPREKCLHDTFILPENTELCDCCKCQNNNKKG